MQQGREATAHERIAAEAGIALPVRVPGSLQGRRRGRPEAKGLVVVVDQEHLASRPYRGRHLLHDREGIPDVLQDEAGVGHVEGPPLVFPQGQLFGLALPHLRERALAFGLGLADGLGDLPRDRARRPRPARPGPAARARVRVIWPRPAPTSRMRRAPARSSTARSASLSSRCIRVSRRCSSAAVAVDVLGHGLIVPRSRRRLEARWLLVDLLSRGGRGGGTSGIGPRALHRPEAAGDVGLLHGLARDRLRGGGRRHGHPGHGHGPRCPCVASASAESRARPATRPGCRPASARPRWRGCPPCP